MKTIALLCCSASLFAAGVQAGTNTAWLASLSPSGGSGGLGPGSHMVTLAGYPARILVGDGYNPATPTFLAYYLHGDEGGYTYPGMDSFINDQDWVLVAPQAPPGVSNPSLYAWDGRDGGSQSANLAQIKAVLDHMIANYNVYTNFYFGSAVSGGSWFYDLYAPSFAEYPSYFNLNCGGSGRTSVAAPGPYVAANSELNYTIGTDDFLFSGAASSATAYEAAGYQVQTEYLLGVGHCAFNAGAKTVDYWSEVLDRLSGCCTYRLSSGNPTYPDYDPAGTTLQLTVDALPECAWSASSTAPWISLSSTSGMGSASVQYTVEENTSGTSRIGTIEVEGKFLLVLQDPPDDAYEPNNTLGGAYDLRPFQGTWLSDLLGPGVQCDSDRFLLEVPAGEGRLQISLAHQHAEGNLNIYLYNSAFTQITNSLSIDDNEYLDVVVAPGDYIVSVSNPDGATCQTYDLWWDHFAVTCSVSLAPIATNVIASGGSGFFDILASNDCPWSITAPAWITITEASTGLGSHSVPFTVLPNFSSTSRTGDIVVAGETFHVQQDGVAAGDGPDLVLEAISISSYLPPNSVLLTGRVTNVGTAAADLAGTSTGSGRVSWQAYVNNGTNSLPSGGSILSPLSTPILLPGESLFLQIGVGHSLGVENFVFLDLTIDAGHQVTELVETNNTFRLELPPFLRRIAVDTGTLTVDAFGVQGATYVLEECFALTPDSWTPVAGVAPQSVAADGALLRFTVPTSAARRYVRIVRQ